MIVRNQQNLLDIAIAGCGDASAAFALAIANNMSITDDLTPGVELTGSDPVDGDILKFYQNNGIVPATMKDAPMPAVSSDGYKANFSIPVVKSLKPLHGQSLLDLALQSAGDASAAFALAIANGISITDDLTPGVELTGSDPVDGDILKFYQNNGIVPATMKDAPMPAVSSDGYKANFSIPVVKSLKPLHGQSLLDLALQSAGDASAAFALAIANGMGITDDLTPGVELAIVDVINKSVKSYYSNNGIMPATGGIITQTGRKRIFAGQFSKQFA